MTPTDLRFEFCKERGIQYSNFIGNLLNTRNGYEGWLEEQLLIHKNQKLDYEKLKEKVTSREEQIRELEDHIEELQRESGC